MIRLILVDDHEIFTSGLKASLEKYGDIQVCNTFTNPQEALSFLRKENVDLVITDIAMPEINGIEFIKKIRTSDISVKILAISMFKPPHYEKNFYDGYLLKDTAVTKVVEAIESIVYKNTSFFYDDIDQLDQLDFAKSIVTKREKEIIRFIAAEYTVDEIAEKLFLSRYTIETHKKNIFIKLQVKTNAGLVSKALQLGYL